MARLTTVFLLCLLALFALTHNVSAKKKETPPSTKMLQVIGAGWTGTGSDVLVKALNVLGLGPTYHMGALLSGKAKGHVQQWIDHADGRKGIDWKVFFANYSSVVDFPAAVYYKELTEAFPEAKVVLTHIAGSSWALNARETTFRFQTAWPRRLLGLVMASEGDFNDMNDKTQGALFSKFRHGRPISMDEEQQAIKTLKDWEAEVKTAVPAERLLEWDPAHGWEPLCSFLSVPVPSAELPKGGGDDMYKWAIWMDLAKGWGLVVVSAVVLVGAGVLVGYDYGWSSARKHFGVSRRKVH